MKICFASDLHGREQLYQQLAHLLDVERPDLLILGGDLLIDGDADDPVATQVAYIDRVFMPRIAEWRARYGQLSVACIVGNHDWRCAEQSLQDHASRGSLALLDATRPWVFAGIPFIGFPLTPPTPYWVKDNERLDLADDPTPEMGGAVWDAARGCVRRDTPQVHFRGSAALEHELSKIPNVPGDWIFVCHTPPHACNLDRLPHVHYPVGSRAVRRFIEQRKPSLALHGHIHESPQVTGRCVDRIGQTLCVNPGQSNERLWAVVLDSRDPAGTLRHTGLPASVAKV